MKHFIALACLIFGANLSAQALPATDSAVSLLSLLDIAIKSGDQKERLLRGFVHTGFLLDLRYSQRHSTSSTLLDFGVGLSAGPVVSEGALGVSAYAIPIDAGLSFRYLPKQDNIRFYVGPYLQLQMHFNQYIQLDAQHPYWFTNHQIGVRNWVLWNIETDKLIVAKSDLSLISLVSRPPEWRDFATYTLNVFEIIGNMHEDMNLRSFPSTYRFNTRFEYQVYYESRLPIMYFLEFDFTGTNYPAQFNSNKISIGISFPLAQ